MEIDDDSGHYDTPWEYKNRAIVAALSKSSGIGVLSSMSTSSTPSTSSSVSSPVQQFVYSDENHFNENNDHFNSKSYFFLLFY